MSESHLTWREKERLDVELLDFVAGPLAAARILRGKLEGHTADLEAWVGEQSVQLIGHI